MAHRVYGIGGFNSLSFSTPFFALAVLMVQSGSLDGRVEALALFAGFALLGIWFSYRGMRLMLGGLPRVRLGRDHLYLAGPPTIVPLSRIKYAGPVPKGVGFLGGPGLSVVMDDGRVHLRSGDRWKEPVGDVVDAILAARSDGAAVLEAAP